MASTNQRRRHTFGTPFRYCWWPCSARGSSNVHWLVLVSFWLLFNFLLSPFWFPFDSFWLPICFLGSFSRVHANSALAGPRFCRAKNIVVYLFVWFLIYISIWLYIYIKMNYVVFIYVIEYGVSPRSARAYGQEASRGQAIRFNKGEFHRRALSSGI